MSNYNSLKTTIDANIKQNGRQEITGQILNSVLNQMVTTLGTGYQFAGVATIATKPGTPDAKVFYIANGKGTYEKFGGINVTEDDVVVLYWDSSWHKVSTGIASDEKLSELNEKFGEYPPIELSLSGYIGANGGVNSSKYGIHSDHLPISRYKSISAKLKGSDVVSIFSFYDEGGNIIPSLNIMGEGFWKDYVVDLTDSKYAEAKTIVLCAYDYSKEWQYLSVEAVTTSLIGDIQSDIQSLKEQIGDVTVLEERVDAIDEKFVENKSYTILNSGYVDTQGVIVPSKYGRNSGYINIKGYNRLDIFTKNSPTTAIAFYDADKVCIPSLSIIGTSSKQSINIDLTQSQYQSAAFVIVGAYDWGTEFSTYYCKTISDISITEKLNKAKSPIDGIKALIFGDSITDCATITINAQKQTTSYLMPSPSNNYVDAQGNRIMYDMWARILQKVAGGSDIRNYARSGASFMTMEREAGEERRNLQYQIDVALNDIPNPNGAFPTIGNYVPDVVIFALGTNDWTFNDTYASAMAKSVILSDGVTIDMDATLSALDDTKVCESMRKAFLRIRKAFPFTQMYCVLPIQRVSSDFKSGTQANVRNALIEMAHEYGVITIDGAFESGIIREGNVQSALGVTLKDGLHPNEKGQNMMARMIISHIKSNYIPFDDNFN